MYTIYCGGASILSAKSYEDSCKYETLLMETALDKVTVLCIQAAYLYGVCSLFGFFAFRVLYNLLVSQKSMNSIDTGSAVLIAFSFIIGILGVSGELGQLVQQGKLMQWLKEQTKNN